MTMTVSTLLSFPAALMLVTTALAQDGKQVELPQKCNEAIEAAMPGMGQMGNMDMPMMQMEGMPMAGMQHMQAMRGTMRPMMRAMMIKDPDLAFACAMIPHHQGAIDMAKAQLQHGKSEELKKIAETLIADQTAEIEELKAAIGKAGE